MRKTLLVIWILIFALVGLAQAQQANPDCVNKVTVWDNDSLFSIAQANNISAVELAAKNGLATNARLRIGDVLCIDGLVNAQPAPAIGTGGPLPPAPTTEPTVGTGGPLPPAPTTEPTTNTATNFRRGQADTGLPNGVILYNVAGGDTLFTIAGRNGADVNDIIRLNNITNVNVIYLGETLLIPKTETNENANPSAPTIGTGGPLPPATPAPPAQPTGVHRPVAGTIPTLNLPQSGQLGGTINVLGGNFPGNTPVNLYVERPSAGLRSSLISQVTTAADGTFSASITLPSTWADGQAIRESGLSVSAYATFGGYWAMNSLVISAPIGGGTTPNIGTGGATTPNTGTGGATTSQPVVGTIPLITLPAQAKPGDTITVAGSNYPANTPVTLYIERPSLGLKSAALGETTTDATGRFSTSLTIPATWSNGTAVNQTIVSVSGYSNNGFWGMNYFVNR